MHLHGPFGLRESYIRSAVIMINSVTHLGEMCRKMFSGVAPYFFSFFWRKILLNDIYDDIGISHALSGQEISAREIVGVYPVPSELFG